jgi:hypothetical protein
VAKKSRTPPPPPRRSQGPRKRTDSRSPDADRRNRLILYALAASGVLALAVVLGVLAFGGGSGSASDSVASAMTDADCTFKTYKEQPASPHYATDPPDKPFKFNSFPPSSGRHYVTPAVYDFYTAPVSKYAVVHNLEHGAIVVQWGNKVPRSEVAKIREWWQNDARGIVAAPLPALGDKIAETAWTHVAKCTRFDDGAFTKFRDAYQFKGPEKIPPETMDPGSS